MSNIDERIVQMKFDNNMFERNVATSISSLEKLKNALNFSGVTNSINNIERTINAADFSKLMNSVDAISRRFSTFGIVGMTVIQDLVHSAENLGAKLYNSTIGQIKSGGWSRATNIDKAKFAIEGLKMSWDELEGSISNAVNDTRFGFDEAATAASQLAASNVQVGEEMDNALKSIANVASQTGAEYSEIAHIYTVVAGNGKLMAEQMQQFSYRGFNAAAAMASVWGVTEAEVREMASKGEISFKKFSDAMNEYLGEGAKRANQTFEGSMANMKAALSRIGQPFYASYRKHMVPVFNALKELIKSVKNQLEPLEKSFEVFADKMSNFVSGVINKIDTSWVKNVVDGFVLAFTEFDQFMSTWSPLWHETSDAVEEIIDNIDKVASMAKDVLGGGGKGNPMDKTGAIDALNEKWTDLGKNSKDVFGIFVSSTGLTIPLMRGMERLARGTGAAAYSQEYFNKVTKAYNKERNKTLNGNKLLVKSELAIQNAIESTKASVFEEMETVDGTRGIIGRIIDMLGSWTEKFHEIMDELDKRGTLKKISLIFSAIRTGVGLAIRVFSIFINAAIKPMAALVSSIVDVVYKGAEAFAAWITKLKETAEESDFLFNLEVTLIAIFNFISKLGQSIVALFGNVETIIINVLSHIEKLSIIQSAIDMVWSISEKFNEVIDDVNATLNLDEVSGKVTSVVKGIQAGVSLVIRVLSILLNASIKPIYAVAKSLCGVLLNAGAAIGEWLINIKKAADESGFFLNLELTLNKIFGFISGVAKGAINLLGYGFQFAGSIIEKVGVVIGDVISKVTDFFGRFKQTEAFYRIEGAFNSIKATVIELKEKGFDAISNAIDKFKSTNIKLPTIDLEKILQVVSDIANNVATFINETISKIDVEKVIEGIGNALSFVWGIIVKIGGVLFEGIKIVGSGLMVVVGWIGKLASGFAETLSSINASGGFNKITETFGKFLEVVRDLISAIGTGFRNAFKKIKGNGIKLPTNIFKKFGEIVTTVIDAITNFLSWLISKIDIEAVISGISDGISFLWDVLSNVAEVIGGVLSVGFDYLLKVLKGLIGIVGKVAKGFSEFFKAVKNGNVGEFFTDMFSNIGSALLKAKDAVIGWIGDRIEDFKNGNLGLPEISLESLDTARKAIWQWLQDRWADVKGWFYDKFHNEEGNFVFPVPDIGPLKDGIDGIVAWIKGKIKALQKWLNGTDEEGGGLLTDLRDLVTDLFGLNEEEEQNTGEKGFLGKLFDGLKSLAGTTVLTAIDVLKSLVDILGELIPLLLDLGSTVITGGVDSLTDWFKKLNENEDTAKKLETIKKALWNIAKVLLLYKSFKGVLGIFNFFKNIGKIVDGFKNVIENASKAIKSWYKNLNASTRELNSRALLNVAKAVVAFAAAFYLLGHLNEQQFATGAKAILLIAGALSVLILLLNLKKGNGTGVASNPLTAGLSIIGNSIKSFGESIAKAMKSYSIAALLLSFGYAVSTVFSIFKQLAKFDMMSAYHGMELLGLLLAEIVGSIKLLNAFNGKKTFGNQAGMALELLALAYACSKIANVLIKLGDISKEKLDKAVSAINKVMFIAFKLTLLGGSDTDYSSYSDGNYLFGRSGTRSKNKKSSNSKWKTILATAGLIWIVGNALTKLSGIDENALSRAVDAMSAVFELCVWMMFVSGKIENSEWDSSLMSVLKRDGGGGLFGRLTGVTGKATEKTNKGSKSNSSFENIKWMCAMIGTVALSLFALGAVPPDRLEAAGNAIAAVVGACVGLMAASALITDSDYSFSNNVLKNIVPGKLGTLLFGSGNGKNAKSKSKNKSSTNTAMKNILAIAGLILVVGAALNVVGSLSIDKIEAASDAIASIAGICIGLLIVTGMIGDSEMSGDVKGGLTSKIFGSSVKSKKKGTSDMWKPLLAICGIIGTIALAIIGITQYADPAELSAATEAISQLMLAASALIVAVGFMSSGVAKLGQVENSLQLLKNVGVTLIFVGGLLAEVCIAFMWMLNVDFDPGKFQEVGVGFFTALAGIAMAIIACNAFNGIDTSAAIVIGIIAAIFGVVDALDFFLSKTFGDKFERGDIFDHFVEFITDGLYAIGSGINAFLSGLTGTENLGKELREGVEEFGTEVGEGVLSIPDRINNLIDGLKQINVDEFIENIGNTIKKLPGILIDFTTDMGTFFELSSGLTEEDTAHFIQIIEMLVGMSIADTLAAFFHNLAGDEGLVTVVTMLNDELMPKLSDFIESSKSCSEDDIESITGVIEALVHITAVEGIATLFGYLFGEDGLLDVTKKLPDLAQALIDYSDALSKGEVNVAKIKQSAAAAKAMVEVANEAPRTGGAWQAIAGEKDLGVLGNKISIFCVWIKRASAVLNTGTINVKALKDAATAGGYMADLTSNLVRTGGIWQDFAGEKDLSGFGENVKEFCSSIVAASQELNKNGGVDKDGIQVATDAGNLLAALEHATTAHGGLVQALGGEKSLATFGQNIKQFGKNLASFCDDIKGHIDQDVVDAAKLAGDTFNELEQGLTAQDGLLEIFTGDAGLDDFGDRLQKFGVKLVEFSDLITGKGTSDGTHMSAFDNTAVETAVATLNKLWDFIERVEGTSNSDAGEHFLSLTTSITEFSKTVDFMLEFYQELGASVLSRDAFDASGITNNCKTVGGWIVEALIEGIISSINGEDTDSTTSIIRIGNAISKSLTTKELQTEYRNRGSFIGTYLLEGIGSVFGESEGGMGSTPLGKKVKTAFEGICDVIFDVADSKNDKDPDRNFKKTGSTWITYLKAGMTSTKSLDILEKAAESVYNKVHSVLNSVRILTSFTTLGEAWMNNLGRGISNYSDNVRQQVTDLVNDVTTALNGINTDVDSARDKSGVHGLREAADDTVDTVTEATDDVTNSATKGLASTYTTLANLLSAAIDDSIDTAPKIAPTLDLSNLRSGAASINSILGNAPTLDYANKGIRLAGTLSGDASADKGVTGLNPDETMRALNGIRTDLKNLGDEMSRMQIVMNSGSLVGEITGDMDRSLGARQRLRERWA